MRTVACGLVEIPTPAPGVYPTPSTSVRWHSEARIVQVRDILLELLVRDVTGASHRVANLLVISSRQADAQRLALPNFGFAVL